MKKFEAAFQQSFSSRLQANYKVRQQTLDVDSF